MNHDEKPEKNDPFEGYKDPEKRQRFFNHIRKKQDSGCDGCVHRHAVPYLMCAQCHNHDKKDTKSLLWKDQPYAKAQEELLKSVKWKQERDADYCMGHPGRDDC